MACDEESDLPANQLCIILPIGPRGNLFVISRAVKRVGMANSHDPEQKAHCRR